MITLNNKPLPQHAIDRLEHDGAVIRAKTLTQNGIFCSIHGDELDKDGDCPTCGQNEEIVALDMAEARAMRLADIVAENGIENLEENLPYYEQDGDQVN